MSRPDVDKVIAKYIQLRDERSELKREYEQKDALLKEQMNRIEQWIKAMQKELGVTQLKSPSGTAFQTPRNIYTCVDWGAFHQWLRENNRLDLLEKRVGQRALNEFREENGTIPPGLNVISEIEISIRRS
jgi:chromosome condensin MukBEF ATPase and DNA-binding subunit MukB